MQSPLITLLSMFAPPAISPAPLQTMRTRERARVVYHQVNHPTIPFPCRPATHVVKLHVAEGREGPRCGPHPAPLLAQPRCGPYPAPLLAQPRCGPYPALVLAQPRCGSYPALVLAQPRCGSYPALVLAQPRVGGCGRSGAFLRRWWGGGLAVLGVALLGVALLGVARFMFIAVARLI